MVPEGRVHPRRWANVFVFRPKGLDNIAQGKRSATLDGELVEDTYDWYAQDNEGNIWYFGEDFKESDYIRYEDQ
ncbi:hypothetical protein QUF80_07065 [Desulfococcaceae bacterium HSG8]|nr:hypothetical protein [Desulfococcaceae bacterium HSG8]